MATFYGWVRTTREVLLSHLEAMGGEAYRAPQDVLGGESLAERHRHVAGCYAVWLGRVALGDPDAVPLAGSPWPEPAAARSAFAQVDALVARFLDRFGDALDQTLERRWRGRTIEVTPRWLLAHPITHEFHHKGQIVVACRLSGAPAPDTDLVPPGGW
ncbi:MAG: DinB family protein [Firmicutes bacterium]|nr:DinB family protein [Bacillota bacterium]